VQGCQCFGSLSPLLSHNHADSGAETAAVFYHTDFLSTVYIHSAAPGLMQQIVGDQYGRSTHSQLISATPRPPLLVLGMVSSQTIDLSMERISHVESRNYTNWVLCALDTAAYNEMIAAGNGDHRSYAEVGRARPYSSSHGR
jgi:hypothetical protein